MIYKQKDKQYNGQKKKDQGTNNDLQHTTQKTKDWATWNPLKT
jgi:cytosine/uracil/thiamine/allantoin permease